MMRRAVRVKLDSGRASLAFRCLDAVSRTAGSPSPAVRCKPTSPDRRYARLPSIVYLAGRAAASSLPTRSARRLLAVPPTCAVVWKASKHQEHRKSCWLLAMKHAGCRAFICSRWGLTNTCSTRANPISVYPQLPPALYLKGSVHVRISLFSSPLAMSVFAFTIGSFGDIATILQLAWAIHRSLSESSGTSEDIRAFIADIDVFTSVLQKIKSQRLSPDLQSDVDAALQVCFDLLKIMQTRMERFKDKITRAKGVAVWREYLALCAWDIMGGKREVEALRTRLLLQITVIESLFSISQRYGAPFTRAGAVMTGPLSRGQEELLHLARNQHIAIATMFSQQAEHVMRLSRTCATMYFFNEHGAQFPAIGEFSFKVRLQKAESIRCGHS